MGEDDISRQILESSHIMADHSYYKMTSATLPSNPSFVGTNNAIPMNGYEKSKPAPTPKDKVKTKRARVEDIVKNLKSKAPVKTTLAPSLIPPAAKPSPPPQNPTLPPKRPTPSQLPLQHPNLPPQPSPKIQTLPPKLPTQPPPKNITLLLKPSISPQQPPEIPTPPQLQQLPKNPTLPHKPPTPPSLRTSTPPRPKSPDDSSFASMCTIREEHDDIEFLPPLKPLKEQLETPLQENKTVYLISTSQQSGTQPMILGNRSTASTGPRIIYQTVQQNKTGANVPLLLNKTPSGNILSSGNIAKPGSTPAQTQRKLLLISSPGAPPVYLNIPDKPASLTNQSNVRQAGTVIRNNTQSGKDPRLPFIIQYRLPFPNNNCKLVHNSLTTSPSTSAGKPSSTFPNLACNETLGSLDRYPVMTAPGNVSMDFAGGHTAYVQTKMPEEVSHPSKTTARTQRRNKRVDSKRSTKSGKLGGKGLTKINLSIPLKSHQPKLPSVRVSNRKKHMTEKALFMDKKKKRAPRKKEVLQGHLGMEKLPLDVKIGTQMTNKEYDSLESNNVDVGNLDDFSGKLHASFQNEEGTSADASSNEANESGSLLRDPALLTREERALQRALMLFKEMENKQANKTAPHEGHVKPEILEKAKGNQNKQSYTNIEHTGKRKLVDSSEKDTFVKRQKINVGQNRAQGKIAQLANKLAKKAREKAIASKRAKKQDIVQDVGENKIPSKKRRKRKHAVNTDEPAVSGVGVTSSKHFKTHKSSKSSQTSQLSSPKLKSPTTSHSSTKEIKSPQSTHPKPSSAKGEKNKDLHDKHRVKTYMLIPSYNGFKDFAPVLLNSRTRNKKPELVKPDADDSTSATMKQMETPKKDVPLLVIETVNNKPVKEDVVVKDDQLRNLVTSSLRAQGMLNNELQRKDEDESHFENREMRHITVNRNTGETVLHKAARMGYDETVYHSIQQGCNSNAKDYAGWTPLHEACSRGHSDVVKVLVRYNADANSCSNDGIRPLHDAAQHGNTDSLRLLMAYGADPLLSTYSGRSCLDCAKQPKAKEYIKACIGDLYLTDERNATVELDYEDRWEFRGSCSVLDKDAKYMSGIFDDIPASKRFSSSVEFEWSDTPHLTTYNLPLKKDGVITGRKNYVRLQDLQERLGKTRNTLIRLLKRTEIREVPWSEFSREMSTSCFGKTLETPAGSSTEEGKIELVPLNWNVRYLLKIKRENISL